MAAPGLCVAYNIRVRLAHNSLARGLCATCQMRVCKSCASGRQGVEKKNAPSVEGAWSALSGWRGGS